MVLFMVCIAKENNVKIFTCTLTSVVLWWHAAVFLLYKGGELMLVFEVLLGAPFHYFIYSVTYAYCPSSLSYVCIPKYTETT